MWRCQARIRFLLVLVYLADSITMSSHLDTDLLIYARLLLFYFFLKPFQRRCVRGGSVGL
jgi:nitrate reductase beta subunit